MSTPDLRSNDLTGDVAGPAAIASQLSSTDQAIRLSVAERLMHPPHLVHSYVLVLAMNDESDEVREAIASALEDYGPPLPDEIAPLTLALLQPNSDVAYWAATMLGRARSDAAPAVKQLIEAIQQRPETQVQERAVWALGQIGPAAQAAVATLQQLAETANGRLQRLAQEALVAISSKE